MKKIVKFLLFIFLFFGTLTTFAQRTSEDLSDWKLYKEISGLQIYSKEIGCHDNHNGIHEKYIVFQFINSTSEEMEITWEQELWYDGKCFTCNRPSSDENLYKVNIAPSESVEGNCDF